MLGETDMFQDKPNLQHYTANNFCFHIFKYLNNKKVLMMNLSD